MKKEFNITEWILEQAKEKEEYPPYMYSPVGFSCAVCKYHYMEDDKHMCENKQYQEYKGTAEIVDDNGDKLGSNKVGEIWVTSLSKACGYWNKIEQTKEDFQAKLNNNNKNYELNINKIPNQRD